MAELIQVVHLDSPEWAQAGEQRRRRIDQRSALGNPFQAGGALYLPGGVKVQVTRELSLLLYRSWIEGRGDWRNYLPLRRARALKAIAELRRYALELAELGSRPVLLGCRCQPEPCHGDVIKRIVEEAAYGAA